MRAETGRQEALDSSLLFLLLLLFHFPSFHVLLLFSFLPFSSWFVSHSRLFSVCVFPDRTAIHGHGVRTA